jgi:hypothetical protein
VPQSNFSFVRAELFGATPSGLIVSPWRARAFDSTGGLLDTVSESQLAFFGTTPAVPFTLTGPGITSVIIDRTTLNTIAGLNRVPTDNWIVDVPTDPRREIVVGSDLMFGNYLPPDLVGVHRRNRFFIDHNGNGKWSGTAGGDGIYKYAGIGDLPITGDWNGDGFDEIGVYRSRNSKWYLDSNSNGVWDPGVDLVRQFGVAGVDQPVVGDWNGDGFDDVGVRRGNRFVVDANGNGVWDTEAGGDAVYPFGGTSHISAVGDWNADGQDDLGVYVPSSGKWYLDSNGNRQWDGLGEGLDDVYNYGQVSQIPVTGDWVGDGKDQIGTWIDGLFRVDWNDNGTWDRIAGGDRVFSFGVDTDTPIVGKWTPTPYAADLLAASGAARGPAAEIQPLTVEMLGPLVQHAIDTWSASPLSADRQQALGQLEVHIADLPGAVLGQAFGSTITLDVNAAGHGWMLSGERRAESREPEEPSENRMDLLTAVFHELGHVLGFHDDYSDPDSDDLMNGWLDAGERRTLTAGQRDHLFAEDDWLDG